MRNRNYILGVLVVMLGTTIWVGVARAVPLTGATARHYVDRFERERGSGTEGWRIGRCNRHSAAEIVCWTTELGVWEPVPGLEELCDATYPIAVTRWPHWFRLVWEYIERPWAAYPR